MKIYYIILLTSLISFSTKGYAQDYSKNSVTYGIGKGHINTNNIYCAGNLIYFGYQRNLWKDRIRFNPSFTFGNYSFIPTDTRAKFLSPQILTIPISMDILYFKGFSVVGSFGLSINYTSGLLGTGGWVHVENSEEYEDFNYGAYVAAGLRYNPPKWPVAFQFTPYNYVLFKHTFSTIGIEVKLR